MRPIYHWSPNRIRAHISICFIAYRLMRYVEYKMRDSHFPISIDTIREELRHVQSSIVVKQKTKQYYVIPSKSNSLQQIIYRCFAIKRSLPVKGRSQALYARLSSSLRKSRRHRRERNGIDCGAAQAIPGCDPRCCFGDRCQG